MPLIQTDSQHYSDIADAIRSKKLSTEEFYPSEMAAGVRSIPQTIAPIIYSLEEQEVGVWIDGKPLYEKTYKFTSSNLERGHIATDYISGHYMINDLNYDQIWVDNCYLRDKNSSTQAKSINLNFPNGSEYIRANIQKPSGYGYSVYIKITYTPTQIYNDLSDIEFFITIRYTKTTDVPAHNYSTAEQVIGTWIDGKTLYEKTYKFTSSNLERGHIGNDYISGHYMIDDLNYDQIWIDNCYLRDKNSGTQVKSVNLNFPNASDYIGTNIQKPSGYGYSVYIKITYTITQIYNDLSDIEFFITIRYTKSTT